MYSFLLKSIKKSFKGDEVHNFASSGGQHLVNPEARWSILYFPNAAICILLSFQTSCQEKDRSSILGNSHFMAKKTGT